VTACTSNQVKARVDSQGGQVTVTTGTGNVVESKPNADQLQRELDLKNKEIELANKAADLAKREKELAEQRLADAQKDQVNKGSSNSQSSDDDELSTPIPKIRRRPVRPRTQSSCSEQSYSAPSYSPQNVSPSYQPSSNYQPSSSYRQATQSVASYQTSDPPAARRTDTVEEYYSGQQALSRSGYTRDGLNRDDDKPKKKSFWKKAWPWIAVGAGAAAGVAIAKHH